MPSSCALSAEARDHALPALVVAVQHLDAELAGLDCFECQLAVRVVVAKRALPEAHLARRDVQIAREPVEFFERRRLVSRDGVLDGSGHRARPRSRCRRFEAKGPGRRGRRPPRLLRRRPEPSRRPRQRSRSAVAGRRRPRGGAAAEARPAWRPRPHELLDSPSEPRHKSCPPAPKCLPRSPARRSPPSPPRAEITSLSTPQDTIRRLREHQ